MFVIMRVFFASPQQHNPRVVLRVTFTLNKHIFSFISSSSKRTSSKEQKNKRYAKIMSINTTVSSMFYFSISHPLIAQLTRFSTYSLSIAKPVNLNQQMNPSPLKWKEKT
jgi:hypothetical protein